MVRSVSLASLLWSSWATLCQQRGLLPWKHMAAVKKFPQPTTVKELQGYLGLINSYRRFLPAVAKILVPLTDVLKGGRKRSEQLEWTEGMQAAFKQSKESLYQATTLAHPDSRAQLGLWVDASAAHIGAVAQQRVEPGGVWQPLGFYSRKLAAAEVKYSAFDRELLACRDGIRPFRHLLEGRVFTIFTNRWCMPLAEFQIHGLPGNAGT
jgi:hypothetical protein